MADGALPSLARSPGREARPERLQRAPQYRPALVDPYRDHLRKRRTDDPAVPVGRLQREIRELLRRVEVHCLPLESARAMKVYGQPSAINRLLIPHAEPHPGRGTVLLLRQPSDSEREGPTKK